MTNKRTTRIDDFERDLCKLINKHSMESISDTPDYILAKMLTNILVSISHGTKQRDNWYRFDPFDPS